MLTTIGIGVLASIAAEAVVWMNKKLTNTVLRGKGAFILALIVSFVGAGIKVWMDPALVLSWSTLGTAFAQVWAVAQVFFVLVVETLGLDVQAK